ncbi:lytic murein transglycosylase [Agaricicola taiwanensis]|nr:lytic murein transglycosylase [Agaricicola taiwanensis]
MLHQPASRPVSGSRRATRLFGAPILALALFGVALLAAPSSAQAKSFQSFIEELWPAAHKRGVSRATFNAAFHGVTPDAKVMQSTRRQAEFTETTGAYLARRVSDARIENGRAKAKEWERALDAVERQIGVDRYVVLSIWGNETNFGGYLGGHNVIQALATLTYNGYRADFFRKELINALVILQQGHVKPQDMAGSWAGAMGHTQFMPSSFNAYAIDFTGDGRRDIWTTIPDALGSTAFYLKKRGWRTGETWGYEVTVPRGFDLRQAKKMGKATLAQWSRHGIRRANGQGFPRPSDKAWLHLPAGANGPAFLMLPNFDVIKRYNNSNNYALAVGHLADRIRGGDDFVHPFPVEQKALSEGQRTELQTLLASRGYPVGEIDGVIGMQTREAIHAYQASAGLPSDGHPSEDLIKHLQKRR